MPFIEISEEEALQESERTPFQRQFASVIDRPIKETPAVEIEDPRSTLQKSLDIGSLGLSDVLGMLSLPYSAGQKLAKETINYFAPENKLKDETTLFGKIQEASEQIPITSEAQETGRRAVRTLPFLLGGPLAYGAALGSDLTGQASAYGAKQAGFGEIGQAVADVIGGVGSAYAIPKIGRAIAQKASKLPSVFQEVSTFSKAEMTGNQRKLQKKIADVSDSVLSDFNKQIDKIDAVPIKTFEAAETEQAIAKSNKADILNQIAPEETTQNVWKSVQDDVKANFQAKKDEYTPLYDTARSGAKNVKVYPAESVESIQDLKEIMNNVETMGEEFQPVASKLRTALKDLGYSVETVEVPQILNSSGIPFGPKTRTIVKNEPVSVDKMMDVAVRLSDMINYESQAPASIKKLLKKIIPVIKNNIKNVLGDSPSGKAFVLAEKKYADTATKFGNKAILQVRSSQQPENLASSFTSPSNYEALGHVTSSKTKNAINRSIIEKISELSPDKARKYIDSLPLSQAEKEIANSYINLGDKLTSQGQTLATQNKLLSSVQEAITTGTRPDYALQLMQTPTGYNLTKQSLSRTPKGKQIFQSLQKQLLSDFSATIIDKSGKIDWTKAQEFASNPNFRAILQDIGGTDLVQFMQSLENYSTNINANFAKFPPGKVETMLEKAGSIGQFLVGVFGLKSILGPIPAGLYGSYKASQYVLNKILSNPKSRNLLRSLSNSKLTTSEISNVLSQLSKIVNVKETIEE